MIDWLFVDLILVLCFMIKFDSKIMVLFFSFFYIVDINSWIFVYSSLRVMFMILR